MNKAKTKVGKIVVKSLPNSISGQQTTVYYFKTPTMIRYQSRSKSRIQAGRLADNG